MKKGDIVECELINGNFRTGRFVRVEIRETSHHWQSNEVLCARVREVKTNRFCWVQAQYLRPIAVPNEALLAAA